ncbi:calcium-binding and coiled-coil domain-containing protein 2 isoform X2 [Parambassis ranga]|uniref:Calcium-binding and coiled-coil domain-containing protein 2 isoform X2 n=1 Tax=Parambassis ranga TaxID=210632 RepID=A0A6P7KBM9_9TELE|nr:calcium-binding and coiled-coil domain-containing protein 2 isoform X2 [Parambassis ranga]
MESPTEAAAAAADARTFSQVVFTDIPYSYPPSTPITCCYTFTAALKPNSRDWVGIFKVGWSTTKDYHTFVWVEQGLDLKGHQSEIRQADFKEYYLPKDETEFYQFCYVDSTGQVRGASTPFCFKKQAEGSMNSSLEDDLLIVTTQQVDQSTREMTELQKELDQIKAENETLKMALEEAANLKGMNAQRDKDVSELVKELNQVMKHNENLKTTLQEQLKENERLKEEMVIQQMDLQQQSQSFNSDTGSRPKEEKYERAVKKINQLKEEREDLKEKANLQSQENNRLNAKLREGERELLKATDSIQLLQVDLQSIEKEKEQLTAEVLKLHSLTGSSEALKTENQELRQRVSQLEVLQNSSNGDIKAQCHTLARELQDAQRMLEAEKQESRNAKRQVDSLKSEMQQFREQLENVNTLREEALQRSSKYEMLLTETNALMNNEKIENEDNNQVIALMKREKEELARENQNLKDDIKELRGVIAGLHAAPASSVYMQPDVTEPHSDTSAAHEEQETSEQEEHLYDNVVNIDEPQEEELLVCRHCQEGFPGITQNELEQHEQSHRVCPFCTLICDNMEQEVFEDHVYSHEL